MEKDTAKMKDSLRNKLEKLLTTFSNDYGKMFGSGLSNGKELRDFLIEMTIKKIISETKTEIVNEDKFISYDIPESEDVIEVSNNILFLKTPYSYNSEIPLPKISDDKEWRMVSESDEEVTLKLCDKESKYTKEEYNFINGKTKESVNFSKDDTPLKNKIDSKKLLKVKYHEPSGSVLNGYIFTVENSQFGLYYKVVDCNAPHKIENEFLYKEFCEMINDSKIELEADDEDLSEF